MAHCNRPLELLHLDRSEEMLLSLLQDTAKRPIEPALDPVEQLTDLAPSTFQSTLSRLD